MLTDSERAEYTSLATPEERAAWRRRYWNQRDPTPGTERNERYEEHLRRVEHARRMYSWPNLRGFDDRGEIYVRYGEPDERFAPGLSSESWRYEMLGYYGVFDFVDDGSGYFRLGIPDKRDQRVAFFLVRKSFAPFYTEVAQKIQANPRVDPLLTVNEAVLQRRMKLALEPREAMFRFFASKSLQAWDFPLAWAAFLRHGSHELEVYWGLPTRLLLQLHPKERSADITFDFAVYDGLWNRLHCRREEKEIRLASLPRNGLLVDQERTSLPGPGKYHVAIGVTDSAARRCGVYRFHVEVPSFSGPPLSLGGIEMAQTIARDGPRKFAKPGGLVIIPNPARRYRRDQPCWLYFEIYNLTLDPSGRSHYRTTLTLTRLGRDRLKRRGLFSRLAGIFRGQGGRSELSLVSEAHGTSATEYVPLQLDVHELAPGEYELEVRVEDVESGQSASRNTKLWIAEDWGRSHARP